VQRVGAVVWAMTVPRSASPRTSITERISRHVNDINDIYKDQKTLKDYTQKAGKLSQADGSRTERKEIMTCHREKLVG
jgi:hypothetical protein